uniref:SJCHGC07552 protein n=1 Tax=Schistosoma japonicum TaxID=6182 RepID=Q5BRS0_SCHJA|nr:SJCHGC07552 protein [Schistosoma japonicum]
MQKQLSILHYCSKKYHYSFICVVKHSNRIVLFFFCNYDGQYVYSFNFSIILYVYNIISS